jgi:hypothetical protein
MVDVNQTWASAFPPVKLAVHHQCLAAYVRAAELSHQGVDNLWDPAHYPTARKLSEPPTSSVDQLAPYLEDDFLYPPTFLLAPRAALAITNSYSDIRTMFFGLNALCFLLGAFALVIWIGGRKGLAAGLMLPVMWLGFATFAILQWGQVHLMVVVVAVLGMVLIEKKRPALGGLLLATATVTKIFPGVLILYLVARRQWRAVIWTFAGTAFLVLATLIVFGINTCEAFLFDHLPQFASGGTTPFFERSSQAIALNGAIQSIPYKLHELGLPIFENIQWFFSLVHVGLIILLVLVAARRGREHRDRAAHWIALIFMASLSGPYGPPTYIFTPGLWLITLFPAGGRYRIAWSIILVFAFFAFSPVYAVNPGPLIMAWSLAGPLVAIALSTWVVFRKNAITAP